MLAIFAPPLPITLPTALAGTKISSVEGVGNLHSVIEFNKRSKIESLETKGHSSGQSSGSDHTKIIW